MNTPTPNPPPPPEQAAVNAPTPATYPISERAPEFPCWVWSGLAWRHNRGAPDDLVPVSQIFGDTHWCHSPRRPTHDPTISAAADSSGNTADGANEPLGSSAAAVPPPAKVPEQWMPGDFAWLDENDCFKTRSPVVVVKMRKEAFTVFDEAERRLRDCHPKNLTERLVYFSPGGRSNLSDPVHAPDALAAGEARVRDIDLANDSLRQSVAELRLMIESYRHYRHKAEAERDAANARVAELERKLSMALERADRLHDAANDDSHGLEDKVAALEREVERLENATYSVHTCHDNCQRKGCVDARRIRELEGRLTQAEAALVGAREREIASIRHLNRLASWAQQDPTGPWEKLEIQKWVLNEIRGALGQSTELTPWHPESITPAPQTKED